MLSFILFLIPAAFAQDASGIVDLINMANQECTRGTTSGCGIQNTGHEPPPVGNGLELERQTITDHLGRPLPVSVISEDKLHSLKNLYNDMMRVYDGEVCAQRAHKIGDMLAQEGIETVKLYLEPGGWWPFKGQIIPDSRARARDRNGRYFTPHWDYHVVNIVLVRNKAGRTEPYVIDPFMENLAVPQAYWESRLRENPNSSIGSQMIISRFNFGPGDYSERLTEYDPQKLRRAYEVMNGDKRN